VIVGVLVVVHGFLPVNAREVRRRFPVHQNATALRGADLIGGHAEHPPGRGVEHSLKQLAAELQTEVSKFSV
jgi:hypothetical protein